MRRSPVLEVLRIPNVLTPAADVLLGIGVGHVALGVAVDLRDWRIVTTVTGSLFLYLAGLALNDYFDAPTDQHERPEGIAWRQPKTRQVFGFTKGYACGDYGCDAVRYCQRVIHVRDDRYAMVGPHQFAFRGHAWLDVLSTWTHYTCIDRTDCVSPVLYLETGETFLPEINDQGLDFRRRTFGES